MPKFLDQPSWYVNVSGTPRQVWGAPIVQEFDDSSVNSGDILSKQVQGCFSFRNLRVNGDAMSDIDIYAPKSPGTNGQVLVSNGSSSVPLWKQPLYQHNIKMSFSVGTNSGLMFFSVLRPVSSPITSIDAFLFASGGNLTFPIPASGYIVNTANTIGVIAGITDRVNSPQQGLKICYSKIVKTGSSSWNIYEYQDEEITEDIVIEDNVYSLFEG